MLLHELKRALYVSLCCARMLAPIMHKFQLSAVDDMPAAQGYRTLSYSADASGRQATAASSVAMPPLLYSFLSELVGVLRIAEDVWGGLQKHQESQSPQRCY